MKSAQQLTDNKRNLLRYLKTDKTVTRSSLESNLSIVLSQTKLLEEKDLPERSRKVSREKS